MRARVTTLAVVTMLVAPLLALALPRAASAEPVWTQSRRLDRQGEDVVEAANRTGDAVAVWARDGELRGAFRRHGGTWGRPANISDQPVEYVGNPQVVLDEAGRATVTWTTFDGGPLGYYGSLNDLFAAVGRPGRAWSRPQRLAQRVDWAPAPVASDPSGNVSVAWQRFEGCVDADGAMCTPEETAAGRYHVNVVSHPATGAWGATVDLGEGDSPVVAAGSNGRLDVSWLTRPARSSPAGAVTVATRSAGIWGTRTTLAAGDSSASAPSLVADGRGNLTAAWAVCDGSGQTVRCRHQAATRSVSGAWDAAATLSDRTGADELGSVVDLAVDGSGRVTALWALDVLVSARQDGAGWTRPTRLSAPGVRIEDPDLAADRRGDVVATWTSVRAGRSSVLAAYRPGVGPWQRPVTVDVPAVASRYYHPTAHVTAARARFTIAHDARGVVVTDRVDDRTAPVARIWGSYARAASRSRTTVGWIARDTEAGVARVQVRRRSASYRGLFGGWSSWRSTTARSATLSGSPGRTYCFSARAVDRAANRSAWSRGKCVSTPVDDRSLRAGAGWRRERTETRTARRGAELRLSGVRSRRLYVVATTCPRCGTVQVRLGAGGAVRVSLRSATVRHRRLLPAGSSSRTRQGDLTIRVASAGRPVRIDGVVAAR